MGAYTRLKTAKRHGCAFWLVSCCYHSWQFTTCFAGHFGTDGRNVETILCPMMMAWDNPTPAFTGKLDVPLVSCIAKGRFVDTSTTKRQKTRGRREGSGRARQWCSNPRNEGNENLTRRKEREKIDYPCLLLPQLGWLATYIGDVSYAPKQSATGEGGTHPTTVWLWSDITTRTAQRATMPSSDLDGNTLYEPVNQYLFSLQKS